MNSENCSISACRYCGNYKPQGRSGGQCQKLGGIVQGSWKACPLAISVFTSDLEKEEVSRLIVA